MDFKIMAFPASLPRPLTAYHVHCPCRKIPPPLETAQLKKTLGITGAAETAGGLAGTVIVPRAERRVIF